MDSTKTCPHCGIEYRGAPKRKFCSISCTRRFHVARLRQAEIAEYGPDNRLCSVCGDVKPLDQFHADSRMIEGRSHLCEMCHLQRKKDWHHNVEKVRGPIYHPVPGVNEKTCPRCKVTRSVSEFNLNGWRKDGYHVYCKPCMRFIQRDYAGRRKGYASRDMLEQETDGWLQQQMLLQQGKCSICLRSFDLSIKPQVDHCHETGRLRGLLCLSCNAAIGQLGDDPKRLARARKYLLDFRARLVV